MGSFIEFNDTLQITTEQGFPRELDLAKHLVKPFAAKDFLDRVFEFKKPNMRLYHPMPTPVHLVHNIEGKWLYWGKAEILEQTIHSENKETTGKFRIVIIYPSEYMKQKSVLEVPKGCEFVWPV